MARRLARIALAVVAGLLVVLGSAGPASAHATLVGSDPAEGEVLVSAPDRVTLTFDEGVTLPSDAVSLFDADGRSLDSDSAARDRQVTVDLPDELGDGTYVVTWRIVSDDGHPVAGSLTFSVGKPSEHVAAPGQVRDPSTAVSGTLGVAQGALYVALLLAAGLIAFACLLLPPGANVGRVRGRLTVVTRVCAAVAGLAALAVVPLTAVHQQLLGLGDLASAGAWDLALVGDDLTIALLVASGLGVAVVVLTAAGRARGWTRRLRAVALAGATVAVVAPALVGHARTTGPQPLVLATDMLHLVTGAVWLGGLVGLALTLGALRRHGDLAARTLARFSTVAAGTLALLVVAGSFMAWRIVGSWDALFGTRYGTVLMVKVGIAVLVMAVAAANRWVLLPRALATPDDGTPRHAFDLVRRSVTVETSLLVVVLGLTGFLVSQSPEPRPAEPAPAAAAEFVSADIGDLTVLVLLTPPSPGRTTLHVHLEDSAGRPVSPYAAPVVSMRSDDVDLGAVPLERSGTGVYTAPVVLPEPGDWQVQVSLRVDEFDNPVATLTVPVPR
ncbi:MULTISPECIES: copper resistance protein CopC [unclassified Nocardioides]|uniref:copper resistance protein CopC n=1 Tax=unclassified Nocardioides TaxID=2615069 RepID=UPI0006F6A791|nr:MULTISPECIES: copper resistance protein CopC [unclassified Nocardioides]KQY56648.1 hypothetical protein ASD30_10015 [Nocardioides sp. Root140]KRF14481.1 hypothetical protein ASH02_09120 [Nocardioides sp. Soil796]